MFQKVVCFHCVPMQQSCVHRVFRFKTLYCMCSSCVPMQWRRLKVCSRSGSQGTRCSSWNLCRHHVHHHHHPYHKTPGALRAQRANTAQCVLCKVYFSAQPNKLRPILKFKKYYPIEHIFVGHLYKPFWTKKIWPGWQGGSGKVQILPNMGLVFGFWAL